MFVKQETKSTQEMDKIIFGAGCFWGVERTFRRISGVVNTTCGYSGGHVANPAYDIVCSGHTGHAEVVQIEYDASRISLDALLDVFWQCHDPTTKNRQGPDIGTQYRSVIYFFTQQQQETVRLSLDRFKKIGRWQSPVVTEIMPANHFYPAEEYHQRYFEKQGML